MACTLLVFAPGCVQRAEPVKPVPSPVVPKPDDVTVLSATWEDVAVLIEGGFFRDTDELSKTIEGMDKAKQFPGGVEGLKSLGLPGKVAVPLTDEAARTEWAGRVRGVGR